mmetsp:Transcript_32790/g.94173  ORF Transcript_32790/g.94173 Transcript_32790/m.94173 type:complete len:320 (-) Transcript_32790:235-1194(-)
MALINSSPGMWRPKSALHAIKMSQPSGASTKHQGRERRCRAAGYEAMENAKLLQSVVLQGHGAAAGESTGATGDERLGSRLLVHEASRRAREGAALLLPLALLAALSSLAMRLWNESSPPPSSARRCGGFPSLMKRSMCLFVSSPSSPGGSCVTLRVQLAAGEPGSSRLLPAPLPLVCCDELLFPMAAGEPRSSKVSSRLLPAPLPLVCCDELLFPLAAGEPMSSKVSSRPLPAPPPPVCCDELLLPLAAGERGSSELALRPSPPPLVCELSLRMLPGSSPMRQPLMYHSRGHRLAELVMRVRMSTSPEPVMTRASARA